MTIRYYNHKQIITPCHSGLDPESKFKVLDSCMRRNDKYLIRDWLKLQSYSFIINN